MCCVFGNDCLIYLFEFDLMASCVENRLTEDSNSRDPIVRKTHVILLLDDRNVIAFGLYIFMLDTTR